MTTAPSRTPLPGVKVGTIERAPKPEGDSADITVLPLHMAQHEVDELDRVWPTLGFASRSAFLRRAIAEDVGLRAVEGCAPRAASSRPGRNATSGATL